MQNRAAIGRWFAVASSICILASAIGDLVNIAVISRGFGAPVADHASLSHEIDMALSITGICLLLILLGYCLAGIAILTFRFRPPWLRRSLLIASFLLLPAVPLGTILALAFFIVLIWKRKAFVALETA